MGLKSYRNKRSFQKTPEPAGGKIKKSSGPLRFVVQLHRATRLHFDFRIEVGGVLKSWAVPKGPSLSPLDQRLAVQVEDHPLEYGSFEGIIPKGNYGAGTVMLWDEGTMLERGSKDRAESEAALKKGLEEGHITLLLEGQKLRGEFALVRLKKGDDKNWLLLKKRDEFASYKKTELPAISVQSGRNMEEIAQDAPHKKQIWQPRKKGAAAPKALAPKIAKSKNEKPSAEREPPRNIKPMQPVQGAQAFDDKNWIFEAGGNGKRALASVKEGLTHLYSRQLLSYNTQFPDILAALKKLPQRLLLDGEITEDESGKNIYVIQDLLHLDGQNLRKTPLGARKKTLEKLKINSPFLRTSEFVLEKGVAFAKAEAKKGHEWILAKEKSSPYVSGVQASWQKIATSATKSESDAKPVLTNLDKIYWPRERYTKGDLVEYYRSIAKVILPQFQDRPQSLHRHPNGIENESFFHKDMDGYLPRFLKTVSIESESSQKTIRYALCQNEASLLYLVNLGCIEFNPWLSRSPTLDHPDFLVIDLDPDDNDFSQVLDVALEFHRRLEKRKIKNFCKTSGASGLHICVPLAPEYTFEQARDWAHELCKEVQEVFPSFTSLERSPARRKKKIYLDYLQNRRGATLAAAYCVRPRPGATVSAPLLWEEVAKKKLRPEDFTIKNMLKRLEKVGDLWAPMLSTQNHLDS